MRAGCKDLLDVVFVLETGTDDALATAVLSLERINRQATDVAFLAERNDLFFFGNEVFVIAIVNSFANHGAAFVAILRHNGVQLFEHNCHATFALCQDVLQVGNGSHKFVIFGFQLFEVEAGELAEAHIDDGLRLDFIQAKAILQALLRNVRCLARLNNLHDFVDVLRCNTQTFDDVESSFGLLQVELRCTRNHVKTMVDIDLQKILEREELRKIIDKRQVVDAKRCLQLRVLEQVIQDNFANSITTEFNHNANVAA